MRATPQHHLPAVTNLSLWLALIVASILLVPAAAGDNVPSKDRQAESFPYRAALVIEPETGTVLYQKNAHLKLPTASMIKMLTLLTVVEQIEKGAIDWSTPYKVSREVALVEGSQVYLKQGEVFPVSELVAATMIKSANDAAAALAEAVSGSQDEFVELMRDRARRLGVDASEVYTPHGLPKQETGKKNDRLSPHDLAKLGAAILAEPELAELAKTRLRPFRHGEFQLYNSNHLLRKYDGAIGIKTGYHRGSDFCVTAAAERDGMKLIAVVVGAERKWDSFNGAAALFDQAYDRFRLIRPVRQGEVVRPQALLADGRTVPVEAGRDVVQVVPRHQRNQIDVAVVSDCEANACSTGQELGTIVVRNNGEIIGQVPALAAHDAAAPSFWGKLTRWFWDLWA